MRLRCLLVLALSLFAPGIARAQSPDSSACPAGQTIPVSLEVLNPCPGVPATLLVGACGSCVHLHGYAVDPTGGPLHIYASMDAQVCVVQPGSGRCVSESLAVPLGTFSAGHFQVNVVVEGNISRPDSSTCFASTPHTVTFDVPLECPVVPPLPAPLPYVTGIHVGPPDLTPICPGRPIQFSIAGLLEPVCQSFREIQLLPNPSTTPGPQPPIARVVLSRTCGPCSALLGPWSAQTFLPGLPTGSYGLIVEMAEDSECDTSNVPVVLGRTVVPFTVAADCSLPPQPYPSCFVANWHRDPQSLCDAQVSPGSPAKLVFEIGTDSPIAGLQGKIGLTPPGLVVTDLRPIGPAAGMKLAWQPYANGATFVMFSPDSVVVPPSWPCPLETFPCAHAVLEATVTAVPGAAPPPVSFLRMLDLLVTDPEGHSVPFCPTFAPVDMVARICAGAGVCDANGDNHIDVRDLVLMVRCLRGDCTDGVRGRLDCNADSTFNLDDVFCCAQRILRGSLPDSLPPPQPLAGLVVTLGKPVPTAGGFDQSVLLHGAGSVGAARFALGFPSEWTLNSVDLAGNPSDWLHIEQPGSGQALVGLLAMTPNARGDVEAVLHFALPAGAAASGVTSLDGEFVGADGAIVTPPDGIAGVPSKGPAKVELSAARPNPFSNETRFELTLSASAPDVKLAIYDLSGRLVASLHSGSLGAGSHSFVWDGRRADGTRAADGVYFYRARTGSSVQSKRIVSMRGR